MNFLFHYNFDLCYEQCLKDEELHSFVILWVKILIVLKFRCNINYSVFLRSEIAIKSIKMLQKSYCRKNFLVNITSCRLRIIIVRYDLLTGHCFSEATIIKRIENIHLLRLFYRFWRFELRSALLKGDMNWFTSH